MGSAEARQPALPQRKTRVSPADAKKFAVSVLVGNGLSESDAATVAHCLVAADLRGIDTHGINRLPSYMTRIRKGLNDPKAIPIVNQVTPVVAQVDGGNAFGFIGAKVGMTRAIEMAQSYGIGMQALDANMLSLVFTNSSPALPAWGGREKLMGVSPIACGAPGDHPFILDMAPSVAARGKIYKALRRGESIPTDWALDGDGAFTDNPRAALEGVMLPMGGPKGSALAIMMDVFSGVLSGSAFAGHVTGPYDFSKPADVGHFLVAIKPDLFMGTTEFRSRMEYLYQRVVGSRKMAGVDRIYFPGEIEQLHQTERETNGIPFVEAEIAALNEEAKIVGAVTLVVESWDLQ
ncbi:hypothetical protein LTR87_017074 [Friedmanniomyces endolithicus]|nr:hypothetical protein LTR87_017074 [Friedmanniomyces endolithicus]